MTDDRRFRRYADEAFAPRTRSAGGSLRHTLRSAAQIASGGLLAALEAARVLALVLIPGGYDGRKSVRFKAREGQQDG